VGDAETLLASCVQAAERLNAEEKIAARSFAEVGIALPASFAGATLRRSAFVSTTEPGSTLGASLSQQLGCPVWVERSATAGAVGEHWLGAGRNLGSFYYLALSDDVSGTLMVQGRSRLGSRGDAEHAQFSWWQGNVPELLRPVEVYKSSHHGLSNGDNIESVTTFSPETVVVSVGLDNSYGHPDQAVLDLYTGVGAQVYRTDLHGTVVVTAAADGTYEVNATTEAAAPLPGEPEGAETPTLELPYDPSGEDRDCGDFSSQAEAQAFFEAAGRPEQDPHRLDGDGNGVVCESLP
jgi:hypothetical protein